MSWESKTDYCGLAVANKLQIKAATMNRTGQYLEKLGKNAAIAATKAFGTADAPQCEYTVLASHTFEGNAALKLGTITSQDGKKYALQSIHYENGSGVEPKFTGVSREVESGATDANSNHFDVPSFTISPEEVAEILMAAFTLTGASCELTKCALDASCVVNPHTVNGGIVASDVHSGHVQVQATIGQYGSTVPTVAAGTGWDISSPLTCTDPDADLPEWTVTLSKPLAKTVPATT